MRSHDLACRLGGDEFAVLFPETEATGAVEAVQRILLTLESLDAGGITGHSASAGVAVLDGAQGPESFLAAASSALDEARAAGGGQAMVYSPAVPGAEAAERTCRRAWCGDRGACLDPR